MTEKVFALDTKPGIQRDGTTFAKDFYNDGQWVRFQRGLPRKVGGYQEITNQMTGPSRGMWVNPTNGFTQVFSGYNNGLQVLVIDDNGVGGGINDFTFSANSFTASNLNMWQFDGFYDVLGQGVSILVAHPGQNLSQIDSTVNTPVLGGDINSYNLRKVGVFTDSVTTVNGSTTVSLSTLNPLIGAGQTISGTGIPASTTIVSSSSVNESLSGVAITSTGGAFSCTAASGLFVGQTVTVTGTPDPQALASVSITGTSGTFSCTATTGLYVDQPIIVGGTQAGTALSSVTVTGIGGQCSCTSVNGLYIGQAVVVSGTLSGTATGIISGVTYYIIDTDGATTFTLSATRGGTAITTTAGTTTGLTFTVQLFTGVTSGTTYYVIATNGTSTFTLSDSVGGSAISTAANSVSGLTFTAPKSTGLTSGETYYIISTNYSTTFTLSATSGGSAITTIVNSTSGLTFSLGLYGKIVMSNAATASATVTATFDNNVSVSGGLVSLHPYLFVYGNNGLIKNCSAGNTDDWVSADANETNVATGKIVQGLPVRGGSNAPSGLFWSLDSLIRVSYNPTTITSGSTSITQYWRYDIISSQSSILSSQSAIEYDGIYYWCGVDRFLMYNGVVKEIPNNMNQNWFFDNLNYEQRQKVWATKVPRFGEIWWFYPRGDATECTDAIIYNVRENTWYDAGSAMGARRSAGYFSQVFHYPINAGWAVTPSEVVFTESMNTTNGSEYLYLDTYNTQVALRQVISGTGITTGTTVQAIQSSAIKTLGAITGGSLYTNGTYTDVELAGGSGGGAFATIVVSGNAVTSVTITYGGVGYWVGDVLSAAAADIGGTGSGFSVPVSAIYAQTIVMSEPATATGTEDLTFSTPDNTISIWQHEIGVDEVKGQNTNAIESFFETNDIGWVSGGPSQPSMVGANQWIHLERLEPDFIQSGEMELYVTGRPYAQVQDKTTGPYTFDANTGKIDLREQRREMRLKFLSNVQGGNYQVGKILADADFGDVRGYG